MRAPTEQDLKLCPDNVQEAYRLLLAEVRAWRAFERNPIPTNERSTMKAVYASKIATDAVVKGVEE